MLDSCRVGRWAAGVLSACLVFALTACAPMSVDPDTGGQGSDPPPRSDTITAVSQFLACQGNPYALCYYSGPPTVPTGTLKPVPALPCELGKDGKFAHCKCYAIDDPKSVNYVALPSILSPAVREVTELTCGTDGKLCLNMLNERDCASTPDAKHCQVAPVCDYLGDVESGKGQNFYPKGGLISTFSFKHAQDYPISSTDCSTEPYVRYAGCMTAGCSEPYSEDGQRFADCSCPTFVGPFQFGQTLPDVSCTPTPTTVWSAANTTVTIPSQEP